MRTSVQTREIREAILDATDRLLARYGYKKMTIGDLAKEVGIGKGSIYLHFKSKEEIVLSHIDRIVERLRKVLTEIAQSNDSPEKKLEKMLLQRVLFRFDSVQHYTTNLNELLASLRTKVIERRKIYFQKEAELFIGVFKEGIEENLFEIDDLDKTAETYILSTNALLPASLSTQELGLRDEIEEKTLQIARILIRGIKKT